MDQVICTKCGYTVGLGMACDPGECPSCEIPLLHTGEFKAISEADLESYVERQRRLEQERRQSPLV